MRVAFSRKTKTVVSAAAVSFSLILAAVWCFLAFLTVNTISTCDYTGYYGTKVVSFSSDALKDTRVNGVAFFADNGDAREKADAIDSVYKDAFVFVDKDSVRSESFSSFFESASLYTTFCSEDREVLESLYKKNNYFTYIFFTSSSLKARVASEMGYSCAVPYDMIDKDGVQTEHEKTHYYCVYGVDSSEQYDACKDLKVDFVFVTDSY